MKMFVGTGGQRGRRNYNLFIVLHFMGTKCKLLYCTYPITLFVNIDCFIVAKHWNVTARYFEVIYSRS